MAIKTRTAGGYAQYSDVGIGHVPSYQASGHPFVSGSDIAAGQNVVVKFPYVTKSITVMQTGSAGKVYISFVPTASMNTPIECYWELNSVSSSVMTMNVKCTEIHLSEGGGAVTGAKVFAELTRIDAGRMWALTGSGISE